MVLVEGEDAHGATVDHRCFDLTTDDAAASALAGILGTRDSASEGGHRIIATGVVWNDPAAAARLKSVLRAASIDDVILVSELHAAGALAQAIGQAAGYAHTALMFLERDTATLAVVRAADGAVVKVASRSLHVPDATAELQTMVVGLQRLPTPPQALFMVGSGVDVEALGCDYYVFSGHKIYGPTGIGVLYARPERLEEMEPFQGGGDMISYVSVEGFGCADIPQRFEAGTPAFPEAIALGAAIEFVNRFSRTEMRAHEKSLVAAAVDMLRAEEGITLYGPATVGGEQATVVSFSIDTVHPHDFATIADTHNVQIRAGNHCAMPTLRRLGVQATVRMSFGLYSCQSDLTAVQSAIREARKMFG
jgi:hypothetical protein